MEADHARNFRQFALMSRNCKAGKGVGGVAWQGDQGQVIKGLVWETESRGRYCVCLCSFIMDFFFFIMAFYMCWELVIWKQYQPVR